MESETIVMYVLFNAGMMFLLSTQKEKMHTIEDVLMYLKIFVLGLSIQILMIVLILLVTSV